MIRTLALTLAAFTAASYAGAQTPPLAATVTRQHVEAMRHLRLGEENLRAEKWDVAEMEFREAIKLDPRIEMAHYGLGQTFMATKRYPSAVQAYLACREAFKTNVSHAAADDLTSQRLLDDQIQALEEQRTLLQTGRVKAMLSGGPADLDRRIADLRARRFHGTQAAPPVPTWISIALGSAYFRAGALADAEREYRTAIEVDPKLGEAHNNLAVVCMLTGRYADATDEIAAAEKSGFRVNPQLKKDVQAGGGRR